jgi:hypothetical protein
MAIRKPPILPTGKTKKQVVVKSANTPAKARAAGLKLITPGRKPIGPR